MGRDEITAYKLYSKQAKDDKTRFGWARWFKLCETFKLHKVKVHEGIITFDYKSKLFYYAIPSQQMRKVGENEWTSKLTSFLKSQTDEINDTDNIS